jgi:putative transposase
MFIGGHKGRFGVAPICRVLSEHGIKIAPSTYYDAKFPAVSKRSLRDADLKIEIARVHGENHGVYGPRKVWLQLNRERIEVARCTVERLMNVLGLQGISRGKQWKTTVSDPTADRPVDLVKRRFNPLRPNRLWVADFTYVPTWAGVVYVAFVIDAYARRILGWRAGASMRTQLVLDTLEQAVWVRRREGVKHLTGLVHHTDAGSQYTSISFTERLAAAGVSPSIGTVGDAYDNALAETVIGLFKSELINPNRPWKTVDQVRSPPCATSTGSTTNASTKRTATSRRSSSSTRTTVNTGPQPEAGSTKPSLRKSRGGAQARVARRLARSILSK